MAGAYCKSALRKSDEVSFGICGDDDPNTFLLCKSWLWNCACVSYYAVEFLQDLKCLSCTHTSVNEKIMFSW